ncbi:MAG: segregation/condensation protein A [Candidatus Aenigmarchaeota archaeon]|nr:segregation/condensation protein A [Candidatus Aenigmarchaeota archaeon]
MAEDIAKKPEAKHGNDSAMTEKAIDESKLIRTIVLGSDWQEVLENIVVEEGLDPQHIDIINLADSFTEYMQRLKVFDFRIPARFILIAAILLRMKCELLLEEEEEKARIESAALPNISLENIPELTAPLMRKPTRKVTLDELIRALDKAFEFKERKEGKQLRMRRAVENLIEPEEDIELRISRIYDRITKHSVIKFSDLVHPWKRKEIVKIFMPLLHLEQRGRVVCEQEEFFKEITIRIVEESEQPKEPQMAQE